MGKRVFELARELKLSSKELLAELKRLGIEASNHMVQLDDRAVEKLQGRFGKQKAAELPAGKDPFSGLKPGKRILIKKSKPDHLTDEEDAGHAVLEPLSSGVVVEPPKIEKTAKAEEGMAPESVEILTKKIEELVREKAKEHKIPESKESLPKEFRTDVTSPEMLPPSVPGLSAVPEGSPVQSPPPLESVAKSPSSKLIGEAAPLPPAEEGGVREKPKKGWKEEEEGLLGTKKWKNFKAIPKKEKRAKPHSSERKTKVSQVMETTKPRKKTIKIHDGITVKEFAETIGQKGNEIIAKLMEMGIMSTINQSLDTDAAILIADGYGLKVETLSDQGDEVSEEAVLDTPETLHPRSPVVTVMGHVDHGKTSLLDAIRKTRVTEQESGGITQHIGAYTVHVNDRSIVFLDTPGHEAFTAMRARGAKVTDLVVLVVAADDGVMPQTVEAINHAKAAQVPIIVAINKIDKPGAAPERIRQDLTKYELVPEEWGGQNIFVEVSAKKNIGLDHLLEMILLQADVLELKANPDKAARGVILEAKLDRGRGPVATILVQSGTLRGGDPFVCGIHFGKVRVLVNDEGKIVKEAPPSSPVEVIGFSGVPQAGDVFSVVEDEKIARTIASTRMQRQRVADLEKAKKITLDELYTQIKAGVVRELNLIIKSDVQGSAEAVTEALEKLSCEAVKVRVIHQSAGGITETDVMLAAASNAIIIGFNVRPETKAQAVAEREQVDIRNYAIIYEAVADIKAAMEGLLEPTFKERVLGRAEVRQLFPIAKLGLICGSYVVDGVITRSATGVRVLRDNVVVYEGRLSSLRRFKEDVREVQTGYECGIGVENFNDIKVGDVIEAYTLDKVAGKLEG